jgi:hypothetical protein
LEGLAPMDSNKWRGREEDEASLLPEPEPDIPTDWYGGWYRLYRVRVSGVSGVSEVSGVSGVSGIGYRVRRLKIRQAVFRSLHWHNVSQRSETLRVPVVVVGWNVRDQACMSHGRCSGGGGGGGGSGRWRWRIE